MTECLKCNSYLISFRENFDYHDYFECVACGYWTFKKIDDCCRKPLKIVAINWKTNKIFFLYEQCLNCGGAINRDKPLSKLKYGEKIKSDFNNSRFEKWRENKNNEGNKLAKQKSNYNFINSPKYKYYLYLTSDLWKLKREQVKLRDKYICQICFINGADDVHHLTYENKFNEPLKDLISICSSCHLKTHNL
jgi:5-methylcytosine-specific restriction endonuclease McrA